MLVLAWHLCLNVLLQASENEGPQNRVQPIYQLVVDGTATLHHLHEWVGKPVLEL
jgi:hypothetical protein